MNIYKRAKVMFNQTSKCEDEKFAVQQSMAMVTWKTKTKKKKKNGQPRQYKFMVWR